MRNWKFDYDSFRVLDDIAGYSFAKIAKMSGIPQQAISRYVIGEYDLPLQILIKICNSIRLPIHYLIIEEDKQRTLNREDIVPMDKWKPVYFDSNGAEYIFTSHGIQWKDVGEAMGVAQMNAKKRFVAGRRFPVNDFVKTCNKIKLSPFLFLIDPNRKVAKKSKAQVSEEAMEKIEQLTNALADLQIKYKDLEEKLQRLQDNKITRPVSYSDGIMLAAEQEEIYNKKCDKKK